MIIRKFRAPTLGEALEEVRAAFGADAVVLHTRRGSDGPIWRREPWVEVTAAPSPQVARRAPAAASGRLDVADANERDLRALRRAAVGGEAKVPAETPAYRPDDARPAPGRGAMKAAEMRASRWSPAVVLRSEAAALPERAPAPAQPDRSDPAQPSGDASVVALMGPSGSGKTTVAARLAASALASGRAARLATAGTFRPGATAHLRALARSFGAEVEEMASPAALRAWLAGGDRAGVRVVDFGGVNWRDPEAWADFTAWAGALPPAARALLVVPAGWTGTYAKGCLAAFRLLGVREVVLAKCDETAEPETGAELAQASGFAIAFRQASPSVTAIGQPGARIPAASLAGGA